MQCCPCLGGVADPSIKHEDSLGQRSKMKVLSIGLLTAGEYRTPCRLRIATSTSTTMIRIRLVARAIHLLGVDLPYKHCILSRDHPLTFFTFLFKLPNDPSTPKAEACMASQAIELHASSFAMASRRSGIAVAICWTKSAVTVLWVL